jgi:hypothetical protein
VERIVLGITRKRISPCPWRDCPRFVPRPEELQLECEECLEVKSDPARVGSLATLATMTCEVQRKGISAHQNDPPFGDDDALVVAAMGKARIGTAAPDLIYRLVATARQEDEVSNLLPHSSDERWFSGHLCAIPFFL